MDITEALKWTLYYRVLTTVFLLLGVTLTVVGLVVGLGGLSVSALIQDPVAALQGASLLTTLALAVLGLVVWQFGKSYAFVKTMNNVVAETDTSGIDGQALKSEIVAAVDDRLETAAGGATATGTSGTGSAGATSGSSTAGATADAGTAGTADAGASETQTGATESSSAAMGESTTTSADGADDPLAGGGDAETEATASEGTPTTSRGRDDDAAVTSSRGSDPRDADGDGDDDDIWS